MKRLLKPIIVGTVAASIILLDSFVFPLFKLSSGVAWISFISWTVFANSNLKERLISIPGFITGFFFANLMILIGKFSRNTFIFGNHKFLISAMLGVFLVNIIMILFEDVKKNIIGTLSAVFFSIAITFSGASTNLAINDIKLLLIILVYGIIGLLSGYIVQILSKN